MDTEIQTTTFRVDAASEHGAFKKTLPRIVEEDIMAPQAMRIVERIDGGYVVEAEYEVLAEG